MIYCTGLFQLEPNEMPQVAYHSTEEGFKKFGKKLKRISNQVVAVL